MLERKREKTRQSAEVVSEEGVRRVALFVPDDARQTLEAIIADYTEGEIKSKNGTPPGASRVEPIEHIREARLRTFWRDDQEALPTDPHAELWWALWCFADRLDRILAAAQTLGLQVGGADTFLQFPETTVVPVFGRVSAVELLLFATGGVAVTLGETVAGLEASEVVIVAVAEGSEAERAGVAPNDLVVDVGGVRVKSITDARARLSGPVHDDVVVKVKRGERVLTLRIPREQVRR